MKKIIIEGGHKLKGNVEIQFSKNIAMKLVLTPLIQEGKYTLRNIPRISSIENLLKVMEVYNCKYNWLNEHDVEIDSNDLKPEAVLSDDLFSHTSGAILAIQILVGRFGKCNFEKNDFENIGGDNLGSRPLQLTIDQIKNYGIETKFEGNLVKFIKTKNEGFEWEIQDQAYGPSVGAFYSALFRNSKSRLIGVTKHPDFLVILENLKNLGVKFEFENNDLVVFPITKLNPAQNIVNKADIHDFATLLFAGLATESEIFINNFEYKIMSGELVKDYLSRLGVTYKIDGNTFKLTQNNLLSLRPIDIIASTAPSFITEWQVLISPLLTQIRGFSSVAEMWYTDRLGHWEELKKMGANYTYLPNRQNRENKPFVVRINGGTKLEGSKVEAKDLRSGAALIIAGLIAEGETEITGVEHIDRGYEKLVERLANVGAKLFRIEK